MRLSSYYHDLMGKAAKDHGNHPTTRHNSRCLPPRCLLTSAPDTTCKSAALLTALCNYTSTNPARKPVSRIPGETQVLLLQSVMPVSAGSCGQPPRVETQACSTYSEVSHQLQHYLVPSACEGFKKNNNKFRSA